MVDGLIPEEMTESVRYDSSLNSYRESNYFDAIAIYFGLVGLVGQIVHAKVPGHARGHAPLCRPTDRSLKL